MKKLLMMQKYAHIAYHERLNTSHLQIYSVFILATLCLVCWMNISIKTDMKVNIWHKLVVCCLLRGIEKYHKKAWLQYPGSSLYVKTDTFKMCRVPTVWCLKGRILCMKIPSVMWWIKKCFKVINMVFVIMVGKLWWPTRLSVAIFFWLVCYKN